MQETLQYFYYSVGGTLLVIILFIVFIGWVYRFMARRNKGLYQRIGKRFGLILEKNKSRFTFDPLIKYDLIGNYRGRGLRIYHKYRGPAANRGVLYTHIEVLGGNPGESELQLARRYFLSRFFIWRKRTLISNAKFNNFFTLIANDKPLTEGVFGGNFGDELMEIYQKCKLRSRIYLTGNRLLAIESFWGRRKNHEERIATLVEILYTLRERLDGLRQHGVA